MRDEEKLDPLDAQLEAQQELASLHRQYRCVRNNKRTYTQETKNVIRLQKAIIDELVRENKELATLDNVAGRLWNQCFDSNNLEEINKLMDGEIEINLEMEQEKDKIAQVDSMVRAMEEKISQQRKKMKGSTDVSHHKHVVVHKQIRVLTNRLDNLRKKFNIAMSQNKQLRESIDHVLAQKERFQDIYDRLQDRLSECKVEVWSVSESATSNFNVRDEAQNRMTSLRERDERELTMYSMEIKDVMRVIEHDRKLREFMNTKTEDRASVLEEKLISRELRKLAVQLEGLKDEVKKYEDIFVKMKEATGIHETDTLVRSFIETEDKNFALFNYVNAVSTEVESLQDDIKFLRDEIDQTKKEGVENDVRRHEILKQMESRMIIVTTQVAALNKECKADRKVVEKLKPRVEKLFKAIKCDRSTITEMLGGGVTVDDLNIMSYMGIIEQKCNEFLQIKALQGLKSSGEDQKMFVIDGLQGAGPQPAHADLSISPPSIEVTDYLVQGTDTKPLTVDEVQALISQIMLRGGPSKTRGLGISVTPKLGTKKKRN